MADAEAVYIEANEEHTLIFRSRRNPAMTIRFLAGFRELCAAGFAMHHIYTEFSLTRDGLDLATTINREGRTAVGDGCRDGSYRINQQTLLKVQS